MIKQVYIATAATAGYISNARDQLILTTTGYPQMIVIGSAQIV